MSSTDDPGAPRPHDDPTAPPPEPLTPPGATEAFPQQGPSSGATAAFPQQQPPGGVPDGPGGYPPPPGAAAPPYPPSSVPPAYPPYGEPAPYGQTAPAPYGQTAPPPPYGQPAPTAYGSPAAPYGQPPAPGYPYAPSPYAPHGSGGTNSSALALTIVSGLLLFFCAGVYAIPAGVFGILGLTKQSTDPEGSRRMTRYGWIALAVGVVLAILAVIVFFALIAAAPGFDGPGSSDPYEGF